MRDILALLYLLLFLPAWFVAMIYVACTYPLSTFEMLGIGTINGVFLACFKDMWQFYFRKKES